MKRITENQWTAMSTLLLLGPALRILPRLPAEQAGRACWLAALPALPLLLGYALFLSRYLARREPEQGLAELTMGVLGPRFGRAALYGFALWLLFYGGFILRAGADRLVVTVYPQSAAAPFVLGTGLLCLIAALGSAQSLARTAKLLLPPLLAVLLLLLLLSLKGVQRGSVLPVTILELPALLRGSVPVLDVLGPGLFLPLFYLGKAERKRPLLAVYAPWLLAVLALLSLLMFAVTGNFGAPLVTQLTQPFFTLVRNLVFFRSLERIEALVVACWIFPDFLLVSLCLYAAQHCLRLALGEPDAPDGPSRWRLGGKRWAIPLCGAACVLVGLLLAPDLMRLRRLSDRVIPAMSLAVCYLTVPLLALAERIRRKRLTTP